MPYANRTPEMYQHLCEAYDMVPEDHAHASQHAACDYRTARKAWLVGWTDKASVTWATPIKDRAKLLKAQARAIAARVLADRDDETTEIITIARKQAAEAHASEVVLLGQARTVAGQLFEQAIALSPAMLRLATHVAKLVDESISGGGLTLQEGLATMETASKTFQRYFAMSAELMQQERLHVGAPGEMIRVTHEHTVSPEQAKAQVQALAADWEFDVTPKALPSRKPE